MSEPFQPNEGDTVEFYNTEAELWETGIVSSHAADRRIYFVQPDDESQSGWLVNHTNIRPVSAINDTDEMSSNDYLTLLKANLRTTITATMIANLADDNATRAASWWEAAKTYARANRHLAPLVNNLELRLTKAREELWKTGQDRDFWKNRADDLEAKAAKLQAQIDAAPYSTGYPVGDKVAARIAEYRERTHAAEDRAEKAEAQLRKSVDQSNTHSGHLNDALRNERARADRLAEILDQTITERDAMTRRAISAEDRAEELEEDRDEWKYRAETGKHADMLRYFLKDANESTDAAMARAEYAENRLRDHTAETWTDRDGTVRPLGGISRAELARQMYDENERAGREKARADKLATELSELKDALRTLAGDDVTEPVPTAVIDEEGDRWELWSDGRYRLSTEYGGITWPISKIESEYGVADRIYS